MPVCASCGKSNPDTAKFCGGCGKPLSTTRDFFISYTGKDRDWAIWIAQQVEAAGYSTLYQARDFGAGSNFVVEMDRATRQTRRTIAVLSPEYLTARYTLPEWAEAFRRDPAGKYRLLVPVRVRECDLSGLLAARVYIDLVGCDDATARQRLLDGLQEAERAPLPPMAFPGAGAASATSANVIAPSGLPRAAAFVGRQKLLEDLMAGLRAGGSMGVFALAGMGGVGKTALAAEAVALLAADTQTFPGGAAWLSCEGLSGPEGLTDLWTRVARALDAEQIAMLPDAGQRRAALHRLLAQSRRLLLALDNADGLEAAPLLETLVVQGHTTLLLTARQAVAAPGLAPISLDTLPAAEAEALFAQALSRSARPAGARPTPADQAALPRLVADLDGLPLALELTAGYAGQLGLALATVRREIRHDGVQAAPFLPVKNPRQRALALRFDRSWQALAPTPRWQRLFAGLSLLDRTSFPRAAALALAKAAADPDDPTARPANSAVDLAALVDYALVETLGDERYRLHPLLRDYAARRLASFAPEQQERLGAAMLAYWLEYAKAQPGYRGMDALEAEAPGLMGALAWAHDHAWHKEVLVLARALNRFWFVRGRIDDARRARPWALEAAVVLGDPKEEHWATHELAVLDGQTGRLAEARAGYERALALARQLGDQTAEQDELHALAGLDRKAGRLSEARVGYEYALRLARQLHNLAAERAALHGLALLDSMMGRRGEARQGFEMSLELARQLHDPAPEAAELRDYGLFLCKHGEIEQGRSMIERSLEINKRLRAIYFIGKGHEFLGMVDEQEGKKAEAIVHYREALRRFEQVQSPDVEAVRASLRQLGVEV